jgi:hypothetical protein
MFQGKLRHLQRYGKHIILSAAIISGLAGLAHFRPAADLRTSTGSTSSSHEETGKAASISASAPDTRTRQSTTAREADYTMGNLGTDFDRFLAMSKAGDTRAAKALLEALTRCRNSSVSQRNLLNARHRLEKETDSRQRDALAQQIEFHQTILSWCGEAEWSPGRRDALRLVARQLAESGDSEARLRYPSIGQPEYDGAPDFDERRAEFVNDATRYLAEEISAGNSNALNAMAQAHMPPPVEGMTTPFTVDPGKAYTYYYAFALTSPERNGSMESILAQLEGKLSPEEIQTYRREAARIAACCGK